MSAIDSSPQSTSESKPASKGVLWGVGVFFAIVIIGYFIVGTYWSFEPEQFNVQEQALKRANKTDPQELPLGYVFANTLAHIGEVLLYKPGGYMSNDVFPPGVVMDNMPSWEFGALVMLRDAASALRNHHARAQSQSAEDPDLARAEPYFYYENKSWALPSTEAEYIKGINALHGYMRRLNNPKARRPGHFYSRADNLWQHIEIVIKRLGGLSTRLNAGSARYTAMVIVSTLDDPDAKKRSAVAKIGWLEIDDIFWEARGASWALLHILKAIKHDFADILLDKRAMDTVENMIREMENALTPVLSPVILDGDGYGLFANYSLAMANYIARANAAALDLRDIMNRG